MAIDITEFWVVIDLFLRAPNTKNERRKKRSPESDKKLLFKSIKKNYNHTTPESAECVCVKKAQWCRQHILNHMSFHIGRC